MFNLSQTSCYKLICHDGCIMMDVMGVSQWVYHDR